MWIKSIADSYALINLDYISSIGINDLDNGKYGVAITIPHNNEESYIAIYNTKEEAENLIRVIEQRLIDEADLIVL